MASPRFQCPICYDDKPEPQLFFIGAGRDPVCKTCFESAMLENFCKALTSEHVYHNDLHWGKERLIARDFVDVLGADFVAEFEKKEVEYTAPANERVYCPHAQCQEFLGRRSQLDRGAEVKCSSCCGGVEIQDIRKTGEDDDPLKGLERGTDYQLCPGCGIIVGLGEACNHLSCISCKTNFCFLCGAQAEDDSGHWTVGKPCTRFGRPDALRPQFDVPVRPEDETHYARLSLGDFLRAFRDVLQTKDRTPPGWYHSPHLVEPETISLFIQYQDVGDEESPHGSPVVVGFRSETEQEVLSHEVKQALFLLQDYLVTWTGHLRHTLRLYQNRREFIPATEEEASLPEAYVHEYREEEQRRVDDKDDLRAVRRIALVDLLRAMEILAQRINKTLSGILSWAMDLPPLCSILFTYPTAGTPSEGPPKPRVSHVLILQRTDDDGRQAGARLQEFLLRHPDQFEQFIQIASEESDDDAALIVAARRSDAQPQHLILDAKVLKDSLHRIRQEIVGADHGNALEHIIVEHAVKLPTWWADLSEDFQLVIQHWRHGLSEGPFEGARIAGFRFSEGIDHRRRRRQLRKLVRHFQDARTELLQEMLEEDIGVHGLYVNLPFDEPVSMVRVSELFGEKNTGAAQAEALWKQWLTVVEDYRHDWYTVHHTVEELRVEQQGVANLRSSPVDVAVGQVHRQPNSRRIIGCMQELERFEQELIEVLAMREQLVRQMDQPESGDIDP